MKIAFGGFRFPALEPPCSPQGHLATSGDNFGRHGWGGRGVATGLQRLKAKGTAKDKE